MSKAKRLKVGSRTNRRRNSKAVGAVSKIGRRLVPKYAARTKHHRRSNELRRQLGLS